MCGANCRLAFNNFVKIGDKVRVVTIPSRLPDGEMNTRSLFELCVGRAFPIVGFQGNLVELEVGEVLGKEPCMDSIWIEPEHIEVIDSE
jgi:hypothetical protein